MMQRYDTYKDSGVQWLGQIIRDINILETETDGLWKEENLYQRCEKSIDNYENRYIDKNDIIDEYMLWL